MGDLRMSGALARTAASPDVAPAPDMAPRRIVIFAPNVHTGGGLVLLRTLLAADWPASQPCAYLDLRARDAFPDEGHSFAVEWVAPGIAGRLRAESTLARRSRSRDLTLCFHNLPPLFNVRGEVATYIQNAYVIGALPLTGMRRRARMRTALERMVARHLRHRCTRYIVQTPTMQDRVALWLGAGRKPVDVMPIAPAVEATAPPDQSGGALCAS